MEPSFTKKKNCSCFDFFGYSPNFAKIFDLENPVIDEN